MACNTLDLAHFIGKKWTIVILGEIALGKFDGFNKFLKKSGLTPRILSDQLKSMESMGIISKKGANNYKITDKGSGLLEIVDQIKNFNSEWGGKEALCLNTSCLECSEFRK